VTSPSTALNVVVPEGYAASMFSIVKSATGPNMIRCILIGVFVRNILPARRIGGYFDVEAG
jgi:hypothetical protein